MTTHTTLTTDALLREIERFVASTNDSVFSAAFDFTNGAERPRIAIQYHPDHGITFFGHIDAFELDLLPRKVGLNVAMYKEFGSLMDELGRRIRARKGFPLFTVIWQTGNSEKHLSIEAGGKELSAEIAKRIRLTEALTP